MPFAVEGGRCFKCGRAGVVMTRAAAKLAAELVAAQYVTYAELQPGDVIWDTGITGGAQLYDYKTRIVSITPEAQHSWQIVDGQKVEREGSVAVVTEGKPAGVVTHHTFIDSRVRKQWTNAQIQEWLAAHRFVGKRERKGIIEVEVESPSEAL